MGRLNVKCKNQKCKRKFSSGLMMEKKEFENATVDPDFAVLTRCPYCGKQGKYVKIDIEFEE